MKRFLSVLVTLVCIISLLSISANASSSAGLDEVATAAIGKTYSDLNLPSSDWCGYFVGYCINHSVVSLWAGEAISGIDSRNAMTLANWVCAKKNIGTYYSLSLTHYNRLADAYKGILIVSMSTGEFTPAPGDIIVFDWNGRDDVKHIFSHVGVVTKYDVNSATVTYVDGNSKTGKYTKVVKKSTSRDTDSIIGYIRFSASVPNITATAQYSACNVRIACVNGKTVNLYNNPGDHSRATYFSKGQTVKSTYCANMSDGSTWYRITANNSGTDKIYWLKYESSKMTIRPIGAAYAVTFNANGGGVSPNSITVTSGSTYGSLPTPTRDGYTFDGWYTSASGGSQVTSGTTCSSNITLYAHWTAVPPVNPGDQQCEVILDDGSACRRMTVTKGNTYGTLPMPTQDGYTFDGWYTSASGGSQVTSSSTCSSNVTLYAHWTPIPTQETVKITFDPNGGNTTLRSKDITAGSLLTGLPTATRSGYTFLGWTTDRIDPDALSTYTAVVVGEGAFSFDQDTSLYAFWKKNRANYTAFFDANGGSVPQSSKTVTEGYYYGDLPTPSKNGYTFKGWYTSAAGGSEITSRTTFSDSSDITLYAHWEKQNTGYWGSWSGWSTTPAYESSTRQVETRSIQTSSGETEYRYGRYIDSTGGHICWCSTYLGSKGYSGITVQYSSWSTTRYGASGKVWTCGNCNGSHTGIDHYDSQGRPAWKEYSLSSGSYYWEESRQTSDTYETQYRYRDWFSE